MKEKMPKKAAQVCLPAVGFYCSSFECLSACYIDDFFVIFCID